MMTMTMKMTNESCDINDNDNDNDTEDNDNYDDDDDNDDVNDDKDNGDTDDDSDNDNDKNNGNDGDNIIYNYFFLKMVISAFWLVRHCSDYRINHIHVEITLASCDLIGSQQHWFQTKLHDYRFCTLSASRNPFKCFFNLARVGFNWHKRKDFRHFIVFASKRFQNEYD